MVMNALGSIRKYFQRVVTSFLLCSPPRSIIITPGMPKSSASVNSFSSMHATAYGTSSFCTWIAQLRSMSLTEAPPKTSISGWPGASCSEAKARFAASLKRRLDCSIHSGCGPIPHPLAGSCSEANSLWSSLT
jgi:hypothetical protein